LARIVPDNLPKKTAFFQEKNLGGELFDSCKHGSIMSSFSSNETLAAAFAPSRPRAAPQPTRDRHRAACAAP
jgi:hypothetical protein